MYAQEFYISSDSKSSLVICNMQWVSEDLRGSKFFCIYVLCNFSINWLFWKHSEIQRSTEFNVEFSSVRSLEEARILVLFAKIMVWENLFMMLWKSLIYMLNSNGPKTDSLGTPCLATSQSNRRLCEMTNCSTAVLCYANNILTNIPPFTP